MPAPRRLRITLDIDVMTEADRNIHKTRWEPAAKAAIDAASQAAADHLTDDDISIQVHPYYEWKYNWSETVGESTTWER